MDNNAIFEWTSDGGEIINPMSSSAIFSADVAGMYNITYDVTSGNCSTIESIQIEVTENELVEIQSNGSICSADSINIEVLGGQSWSWSGPNAFTSNNQNIIISNATPLNSGLYIVTVTSASGCETILDADITVGEQLSIDVSSNGPICDGGNLELFATGGSSFLWTGPNGWSSNEQNPVINNIDLAVGIHLFSVEVSTFNGCSASQQITVEVLEVGDITVVEDIEICAGDSIVLGVNGGFGYQWTGPQAYTSSEQFPTIHLSLIHI